MGWRELAAETQRGKGSGHERHDRHDSPPNVPNVPNVPGVVPLDPERALRAWRTALAGVDPLKPRSGWHAERWTVICDTAHWLLDGFAEQAARDGWGTGDLFGILPEYAGAGGLVDRIGESRSLVMTANKAAWRSWGIAQAYNRTAGADLAPFWEVDL